MRRNNYGRDSSVPARRLKKCFASNIRVIMCSIKLSNVIQVEISRLGAGRVQRPTTDEPLGTRAVGGRRIVALASHPAPLFPVVHLWWVSFSWSFTVISELGIDRRAATPRAINSRSNVFHSKIDCLFNLSGDIFQHRWVAASPKNTENLKK
jgi:hypothetical protein